MEEFIRILTEQIRCVKARAGVARELRDHMEDQAACYEEKGMNREAAEAEAVKQMGDPVEIGTQLDHIHRPQMDKKLLVMFLLFSMGGFFIQYATGVLDATPTLLMKQAIYMGMGFLIMLGIYFLDYSFIGKYAKWLYALLIIFALVYEATSAPLNGMFRRLIMPMYLFVPVYAGILYRHRREGYLGIGKCILYMFLPVLLSLQLISSLPTACNLFLIFLCMLLTAIYKSWFQVQKKATMVTLLLTGLGLPFIMVLFGYFFLFAEYQRNRIQAFLGMIDDENGSGYIYQLIRSMTGNSRWIGNGMTREALLGTSENFVSMYNGDSSFILLRLVAEYGILFGIIAIVALILIILHSFHISFHQKNQLGLMIGTGCGLVLLILSLEGIGVNFGLLPATGVIMPFLTYGGNATLVYDLIFGLLFSVFRYQNVLCDTEASKRQRKYRLRIKLEKQSGNQG